MGAHLVIQITNVTENDKQGFARLLYSRTFSLMETVTPTPCACLNNQFVLIAKKLIAIRRPIFLLIFRFVSKVLFAGFPFLAKT